jgi:hypothetical protein
VPPTVHETGGRAVNRGVESSPHLPLAEHRLGNVDDAWHLAVRVAAVTSVLAVALGIALAKFVGLDARVILVMVAASGWIIGCHLPVAAPSRWASPSDDDFEDLAV